MTPYQFAILRYRHSASAGELVNVGIVMWLPAEGRVLYKLNERYSRLSRFYAGFDGIRYREMLQSLDRHFLLQTTDERQLKLFARRSEDLNDFLSRLIRRDDSCFQWSEIMAGITDHPNERLIELFTEFVTKYEENIVRPRHDEDDIWEEMDTKLRQAGLSSNPKLRKNVRVEGENYDYAFRAGWMNGSQQVLEPISFDLVHGKDIVEKANTWGGRLYSLREAKFKFIGILSPPASKELFQAYNRAQRILRAAPHVRNLLSEEELDEAIRIIEHDIAN